MEEYEKMTKDERGEIKDKGGFVGGAVSSNRRTKETIRFRSLLTLDVDDAKRDFWMTIKQSASMPLVSIPRIAINHLDQDFVSSFH